MKKIYETIHIYELSSLVKNYNHNQINLNIHQEANQTNINLDKIHTRCDLNLGSKNSCLPSLVVYFNCSLFCLVY